MTHFGVGLVLQPRRKQLGNHLAAPDQFKRGRVALCPVVAAELVDELGDFQAKVVVILRDRRRAKRANRRQRLIQCAYFD